MIAQTEYPVLNTQLVGDATARTFRSYAVEDSTNPMLFVLVIPHAYARHAARRRVSAKKKKYANSKVDR